LVPDFSSSDTEGRAISHLLVDNFIIDYWGDNAAKVVMIVDIEDAQ